ASATGRATRPLGSVDLLHRTASVVITSSHADGNSTGAYLVDELPATSWQPNPPDRLSCREFITHFGPPTPVLNEDGVPYGMKLPTTWAWTRNVEVTRRGSVRLTPCRSTGRKDHAVDIVPCAAPGAEML